MQQYSQSGYLVGVLGAVVSAIALGTGSTTVQAQMQVNSGVYTCVDAKGRKLTADRPIAECMDREQQILNPSGTVKAKLAPSLTAKERAVQELQRKRDNDEQTRLQEERRRERALLIRYPNREVHDQERTQALGQVANVIQAAKTRVTELARQRVSIDEELEFYKSNPDKTPTYLRRQSDENLQSQSVQKKFIDDQEAEVRRVNDRFDDELQRLRKLWTASGASNPAAK
jgi:hypothetical protein